MSPAEPTPARPAQKPAAPDDPKAMSVHLIHLMADGDLPDFETVVHRDGPTGRHTRSQWQPAAGGMPPSMPLPSG